MPFVGAGKGGNVRSDIVTRQMSTKPDKVIGQFGGELTEFA